MRNTIKERVLDKALFLKQASEISSKDFENIQSCLVLVTHPEDKPLGCAGLIAMLVSRNVEIAVLLATDEVPSPRDFKNCASEEVRLIRKEPICTQLEVLGAKNYKVTFFEGKGASLPARNHPNFDALAHKIAGTVKQEKPQLILAPFELDPSGNNHATRQLLREALKDFGYAKVWEYPIGLYPTAQEQDLPGLNPGELKRLNIAEFLQAKEMAGKSHVSTSKNNPADDITGPGSEMTAISSAEHEYYIERDRK